MIGVMLGLANILLKMRAPNFWFNTANGFNSNWDSATILEIKQGADIGPFGPVLI